MYQRAYLYSLLSEQTHPQTGKVISQSESVTKYEITELQTQSSSSAAHVSCLVTTESNVIF